MIPPGAGLSAIGGRTALYRTRLPPPLAELDQILADVLSSRFGAAARYRAVPLVPWAAGPRDTFVTITTEMAEGRRARRARA